MVSVLVSYPENCTGCRFCEMICSLYHEGVVNTNKARLRIQKPDIMRDIPLVCTQCITCGDSCCVQACPEEAIVMSREVELCTFDRSSLHFEKEQLLVPEALLKRRLDFLRGEYDREHERVTSTATES